MKELVSKHSGLHIRTVKRIAKEDPNRYERLLTTALASEVGISLPTLISYYERGINYLGIERAVKATESMDKLLDGLGFAKKAESLGPEIKSANLVKVERALERAPNIFIDGRLLKAGISDDGKSTFLFTTDFGGQIDFAIDFNTENKGVSVLMREIVDMFSEDDNTDGAEVVISSENDDKKELILEWACDKKGRVVRAQMGVVLDGEYYGKISRRGGGVIAEEICFGGVVFDCGDFTKYDFEGMHRAIEKVEDAEQKSKLHSFCNKLQAKNKAYKVQFPDDEIGDIELPKELSLLEATLFDTKDVLLSKALGGVLTVLDEREYFTHPKSKNIRTTEWVLTKKARELERDGVVSTIISKGV